MNLKLFKKRITALYSCWESHKDLWGNSDILVICTSPSKSLEKTHLVSSYFYLWLFGHKFQDTVAIFSPTAIHLICPRKKVSMLEALAEPAMDAVEVRVYVHMKANGGQSLVDDVIRQVGYEYKFGYGYDSSSVQTNRRPVVIGCVAGEWPSSALIKGCSQIGDKKNRRYQVASVNIGLVMLYEYKKIKRDVTYGETVVEEVDHTSNYNNLVDHRSNDNNLAPVEEEEQVFVESGKGASPPELIEGVHYRRLEAGFPSDLAGGFSQYCVVSDECDDWVLVEGADDKA